MVNCRARFCPGGRAAIKRVTWQLLSKFLCSLSVCVVQWSYNVIYGPVETCKLSFRSYIIKYRLFALEKVMQKTAILTRVSRLTVAGLLFISVVNGAGINRATYLCLDSTKNVDKTAI